MIATRSSTFERFHDDAEPLKDAGCNPFPVSDRDRAPVYDDWATYYDMSVADRSETIAFYGSLVTPAVESILELACGTGTILAELAERIVPSGSGATPRIVGLDESANMLRIARERHPQFAFVRGDLRAPAVDGTFDLVLCIFNALQFCRSDDELLQAFRAARALVSAGGTFAFDICRPNYDYLNAAQRDRLVRTVFDPAGQAFELREDASYDPSTNVYAIDWRIYAGAMDGAAPLALLSFRYFQFSRETVERLLAEAGFTVRMWFGDLDRSIATDASKRHVVVCDVR